jgi:hypothetical protein
VNIIQKHYGGDMKKYGYLIFPILAGLIFQFFSCGETLYTVVIKNESTQYVSYEYNGDTPEILAPKGSVGDSITYNEIKAYTRPPEEISVVESNGTPVSVMSVKMINHQGESFTFVDIEGITLNVSNECLFDVLLKADNYIDDGNGSTELRIDAETEIKAEDGATIYTARPKFTTVPGQCTVEWELDDEDKTVMNVTIK